MKLTFLGAAGTVTGSKYLLESAAGRILVDCGLFQGLKQLRLRNRAPFPVDPAEIDAVVLTHAHLDHTGYLPLLVRNGFRGPIYCTPPTRDLCAILLPDSGHLQEEEAAAANRYGYSKHRPALPLYTQPDAVHSLKYFRPLAFDEDYRILPGLDIRFTRSGHMLGSALVRVATDGRSILFSGDLGRPHDPLLLPLEKVDRADYLLVESTYGDRLHSTADPLDLLADVIGRTAARGGAVLIPSFAVGRAQSMLYYIHQLKQTKRIPDLPVFLDSPMAKSASDVFLDHAGETRLSKDLLAAVCSSAMVTESVEDSKRIDRMTVPRVVISASGMITGGRVVHHLKVMAPDNRNTVLIAGYQAAGTRGASLVGGAEAVKIHGSYIPVRAEITSLDNVSAHADYAEILTWLRHFQSPPRHTFVTHGEPVAADTMRLRIEEELRWRASVPEHGEVVHLS